MIRDDLKDGTAVAHMRVYVVRYRLLQIRVFRILIKPLATECSPIQLPSQEGPTAKIEH